MFVLTFIINKLREGEHNRYTLSCFCTDISVVFDNVWCSGL